MDVQQVRPSVQAHADEPISRYDAHGKEGQAMSRLTDEELDEAMHVVQSLHSLRLTAALVELRERRAADLKAEDVEALRALRSDVDEYGLAIDEYRRHRATVLAILDRLTNGGKP
jgi:23S rRNA G2069 N7-methylase RlmK/C1962 C5-methylase RlmI